jgi:conjugative relaxase-like TrwC/TraI family protein
MMTMSRALSSSQASTYYQQEFTNAKENYFSESGEVQGRWSGRLAEEWELEGKVDGEQFERLVAGQDPRTGEQLVRPVTPREMVNEFGEEMTTSEHRAGWDATISAPKSVSLAALVGDDERIRIAHRESVDEALRHFEEYLQARGGGNKPAIPTGKMIAAQFEHTASRPDRTSGYAAPQLHTHVVIFNVTQTEEGKARSVQPLELYRSQKYATAIYRIHLAEKLQKLGYEIEVDPRTGAPEIKGFSKSYLQESSPRREEVVRAAEQIKERLEQQGAVVAEAARLKQAAAHIDRASKHYDRVEMRDRALEMDARYGNEARHSVEQALQRGPIQLSQEQVIKRAQQAVTFARDNAVEREAVADMRKVMVDALRRNLGLTTYEAVAAELHQRQQRGEFIDVTREQRSKETTTRRMLEMEKSNIQRMLDHQGRHPSIISNGQSRQIVENATTQQHLRLNDNQCLAVEEILSNKDQILGLQGGAGTGKTTALSVLRAVSEKQGYEVRGFAPTTRAAKQLAESGINTETLQKFLRRREEAPPTHNRLFILDESSLASTRQLHKFFRQLLPTDKVQLVGDVRQHQAVEAGSPFEQFQLNGMSTAKLTEIVRQRDADLKQTVVKLSARQVRQALDDLHFKGQVVEIAKQKERLQAIAVAYCQSPNNTLVISPANRDRVTINSLIHQQLQRDGKIGREDRQVSVLLNREDMTGVERTFASSYVPDEDVIRYNRASKVYNVKVGDYSRVVATDHANNTLTVRMPDGREFTYNPSRLSGVSVYKQSARDFSEGDRIQFRAPFVEKRIANGELGTFVTIKDNEFTVRLDDGREVNFEAGKYRHIDHGYAVTSHSSQGQTVDRVLINANSRESEYLLNDRMGYVAISRARHDAIIYTNSVEELREALSRRVDKEMALEALSHSQTSRSIHGSLNASVPQQQQRSQAGFEQNTREIESGLQSPINQTTHGEELGIELL